ncbi:MAG: GtrA family protein [Bacteroidales bacterium]|nr:GtrA family protein [Bacteroidales bacterium]
MELKSLFFKFVKFGVVGAFGSVIDFGLTALCKGIFGMPELLANAIGFTVAATNNYILNRTWTWRSTSKNVGIEYSKFIVISVIGLGLNSLIVFLLKDVNLVPRFVETTLDWDFWVAKIIATAVVTLWNFFGNMLFTFKNSKQ